MLTLYVVRHGKTLFNEKHLIQGVCDSPLTEEGIAQARKLASELNSVSFDACYVSPMNRAVQTARYIIAGKNIPLYINENLKEFNFGSLEGDSEKELVTIYPVLQGEHVESFDGEDMHEFTKRILFALDEIRKESKDGNVLVVTHSGVITALLHAITNLPDKDIVRIKNCSVTKLAWNYGWKTVY